MPSPLNKNCRVSSDCEVEQLKLQAEIEWISNDVNRTCEKEIQDDTSSSDMLQNMLQHDGNMLQLHCNLSDTLTSAVWQDAIAGDLGLGAGPMTGGWKVLGNMGKSFT